MERRRGRQEPTTGFTLPYQLTLGREAIEIYQRSGRTAQDWQVGIVYDIMALDPRDELWVHTRYGYSVPRQNGKNEVVAMRELWGLHKGERILHTAHRTSTGKAAWDRIIALLEASDIHEEDKEHPCGYKVQRARGREEIVLNDELGGGHIYFRSRTTTGGLGETFDLLVIDEAQEYQDDQESALKYTIVSSDNPQTIYLGTPPTPYSSGTIFPKLRDKILCGELKNAGWAEWSVEDQTDLHDVDAWYQTNPSLGYKLTERAIEDEIGTDVIDFNIQRLGLWLRYNQKSAVSQTEWDACKVENLPQLIGKMTFGVKFSRDGATVSLSVAVKSDDNIFIECIANRSMRDGVGWLADYLLRCKSNTATVIVDGDNGFDLLATEMADRKLKKPIKLIVKEYIDANALFEQGIYSKTIIHMEQPSVTGVITNCEKRAIGSSGGFGYKSQMIDRDISIMDSLILAAYGCSKLKERKRQKISY